MNQDVVPYRHQSYGTTNQQVQHVIAQVRETTGHEPTVLIVRDQTTPERRDNTGLMFVGACLIVFLSIIAMFFISCAKQPVITPPAHNNPSCVVGCF